MSLPNKTLTWDIWQKSLYRNISLVVNESIQEVTARMELEKKVAIVTGAGNGLGRAITHAFAAEGAIVVVADVDAASASIVAGRVRDSGGRALDLRVDVTDSNQVETMVGRVVDEFDTVDILVNNAGIVGPQGPLVDLLESGFDSVVGVNLKGRLPLLQGGNPSNGYPAKRQDHPYRIHSRQDGRALQRRLLCY